MLKPCLISSWKRQLLKNAFQIVQIPLSHITAILSRLESTYVLHSYNYALSICMVLMPLADLLKSPHTRRAVVLSKARSKCRKRHVKLVDCDIYVLRHVLFVLHSCYYREHYINVSEIYVAAIPNTKNIILVSLLVKFLYAKIEKMSK